MDTSLHEVGHGAQSLGALLNKQARRYPDRVLFRFGGEEITIREADLRSNRLANVLRHRGVEVGQRVGVMLPNGFDFPLVWLALAKIGAVIVPINPAYEHADLSFVVNDSGARLALTTPDHIRKFTQIGQNCPELREITTLEPMEQTRPSGRSLFDDLQRASAEPPTDLTESIERTSLLNVQYTSGTTGFPKGCMLTHGYWLRIAEVSREAYGIRDDDVMMVAQPFFYMDAQWLTTTCLLAGVPLAILPRFSASTFWQSVKENDVSVLYLLGTMPLLLMKQPEHPALEKGHRLRLVYCSGIVPRLHSAFEARWNVPWRETYGTTESGADLFVPIEDARSVGTGAMGKLVPDREARVVDEAGREVPDGEAGELILRGNEMMLGYWNQPEATASKIRNGWLYTGDLVTRDAAGYYHMVGRLTDMVRRGGENIAAAEVEDVLCHHPGVRAAAVVAVPDELRGEEVKAFVQLQPGESPQTVPPRLLIDFVKSNLAAFKAPRFIEYVDDFPRTPSERIAKPVLLKQKAAQRGGCYDDQLGSWT